MSLARVLRLAGVPGGPALQTPDLLDGQSTHSKLGATTTNGDGFGIGWYGTPETPGVFRSTDVSTLRHQYPDNPVLHDLSDDARLVVSEPLGDLHGAWREVPEASCLIVHGGQEELRPFAATAP